MKNFTQKFIGLLALVFSMSFTVNSQEIGDVFQGGYIFQINENGTGLVAAMEDFQQLSWGCYNVLLDGADGQAIGTGYQNTLDIVEGCLYRPIAASAALEYESEGYSDWYLPSIDELTEMYNTIGNGGSDGDIGGLGTKTYWSSSEKNVQSGWVSNAAGQVDHSWKNNPRWTRFIRSVTFGQEVSGCTDASASNYNAEANTDDGSCVSWENYALQLESDLQSQEDMFMNELQIELQSQEAMLEEMYNAELQIELQSQEDMFMNELQFELQSQEAMLEEMHNAELQIELQNQEDMFMNELQFELESQEAMLEEMYNAELQIELQSLQDMFMNVLQYELESQEAMLEEMHNMEINDMANSYEDEMMMINLLLDDALSNQSSNIEYVDAFLNMPQGWSMFGYTCLDSVDAMVGFSSISDKIEIVKDEWGLSYLPSWDFNAMGSLQFSEGYQIKMIEEVTDFQFCEAIVPEDGITQADVDAVHAMYEGCCASDIDNDGICDVDEVWGCMDASSCNYVSAAEFDDNSCDYVSCLDECGVINGDNSTCLDCAGIANGTSEDLGCGCGNPQAQEGYDCDGNSLQVLEIGALMNGGIVFYIDETGEHGLVAAVEDLTEGATDPYGLGFNGYEWGCFGQLVNGADGTSIGTGYQNTMDIVNQGCVTENGGITAAQAALNAEVNGYSDWYLPSKDELSEMYSTIGNEGLEGNIGGFDTSDWSYYWSSSEYGYNNAWHVDFDDGGTGNDYKSYTYRVRVIRAF